MKIKNGRSALILAAGLFVCLAGPSQAAPAADDATATSKSQNAAGTPLALNKNLKHARHGKSYAHGKSSKVALKPAADDKPAATDASADDSEGIVRDSAVGGQRQRATARFRHAGRQRQGDVGASKRYSADRQPGQRQG